MELSEVTALILTFNEAENIGRTLAALAWAREVVLIDSFSTDRTIEIARSSHPNVRVAQREFDTHATQWNFGLDQVTTPWVLALDADYRVDNEMEAEIARIQSPGETHGYEARFVYCVNGKPLRASLYPPHIVLFRKQRGRYVDEGHTQVLRLSGNVGRLTSPIFHDDRKPLRRWIESQKKYSVIEARYLLSRRPDQLSRVDRLRKLIIFAPGFVFLYLLFAKGLIFDGMKGWSYVCQRTFAEGLLSLRLITERGSRRSDREKEGHGSR